MNVRKAVAFVEEHGNALARARAAALVDGAAPSAEALTEVGQLLGSGSLDDTCQALLALHDLGLEAHTLADRGLSFLQAQQDQDGSWFERGVEAQPQPRWLRQGEEAGRLYLSAWVSSLLVTYGRTEGPVADRALDLLLRHQLEGGLFTGLAWAAAWYALPLLAKRLGQRSGPAQNILLTLSQKLAEPGWLPAMFAALLRNLLLAGYGIETPLVRQCWEQLLLRQREDGAWAGEEEKEAVSSTLDVLWCWKRIVP